MPLRSAARCLHHFGSSDNSSTARFSCVRSWSRFHLSTTPDLEKPYYDDTVSEFHVLSMVVSVTQCMTLHPDNDPVRRQSADSNNHKVIRAKTSRSIFITPAAYIGSGFVPGLKLFVVVNAVGGIIQGKIISNSDNNWLSWLIFTSPIPAYGFPFKSGLLAL